MPISTIILLLALSSIIFMLIHLIYTQKIQHTKFDQLFSILEARQEQQQTLADKIQTMLNQQQNNHHEQQQRLDSQQVKYLSQQQTQLRETMADIRQQLQTTLNQHNKTNNTQLSELTQRVDKHLNSIGQQVEKRLTDGFDKTTAIFTDVVKRLALIDQAQQRITELSTNVVSLQEILSDKRARGAFGEVQLSTLIQNVIPNEHYKLQYTLSNGKRVDCMLFLPKPTGNLPIDSKFPLENYQIMLNASHEADIKIARQQFKQDIRKHINDISSKYHIPGETADGTIMFIPAEAIFAEIHAHYPEIVAQAYKQKVWLTSPTTLMAILNTAMSVIKDTSTREQVDIIQKHLHMLSADFQRFDKRMHQLAKHIQQANIDVEQVHKSSQKITSRFLKIEQVQLDDTESDKQLLTSDELV